MNANLKYVFKEINERDLDNTQWQFVTWLFDIRFDVGGVDGRLYDNKLNDISNESIAVVDGCLLLWLTEDTEKIVDDNNPDYYVFGECGGVAIYLF